VPAGIARPGALIMRLVFIGRVVWMLPRMQPVIDGIARALMPGFLRPGLGAPTAFALHVMRRGADHGVLLSIKGNSRAHGEVPYFGRRIRNNASGVISK
jgi:hypothetical protein